MPDRLRYLLIAAQSGRALAQAAQRAGYAPLVADLFGDLDTLELAERHVTLAREGDGAIARAGFGAAIARLTEGLAPNDIAGVVCGSGFEDRTGLIDQAALYAPLLGASDEVTRGLKDPQRFAKLCGALDIAHPTITFALPHDPAGWLVKQAGASGGAHVRQAAAFEQLQPGGYFQRHIAGPSISALFCGDGRHAQMIGFSAQWSEGEGATPYRFAGAAGPLQVAPALAARMTQAVQRLTQARRLRGLNSADFIIDGDMETGLPWLLEINPRPGATLDVFDSDASPLLRHHLAGCAGARLQSPPPTGRCRAAVIVYAGPSPVSMAPLAWPAWTADRQPPHHPLTAGAPACTVFGEGETLDEARNCVNERAAQMRRILDGTV